MISWLDLVTGLAIGIPIGYGLRWLVVVRKARRYLHSRAGERFLEQLRRGREDGSS